MIKRLFKNYTECSCCGKKVPEGEVLPARYKDGSTGKVCAECMANNDLEWIGPEVG